MGKSKVGKRVRYTPEFRQQMSDLVRAGRQIPDLVKEFGCSAMSIHHWVRQYAAKDPDKDLPLTNAEREELERLRFENRQLKQERDILSKAAAWFAQETFPISKRSSDS
jgi:transposase